MSSTTGENVNHTVISQQRTLSQNIPGMTHQRPIGGTHHKSTLQRLTSTSNLRASILELKKSSQISYNHDIAPLGVRKSWTQSCTVNGQVIGSTSRPPQNALNRTKGAESITDIADRSPTTRASSARNTFNSKNIRKILILGRDIYTQALRNKATIFWCFQNQLKGILIFKSN